MTFKKKKYEVIRGAIKKSVAEFVMGYFLLKRQVAETLFNKGYISPFCTEWGVWHDEQVPNTYGHYADVAMETFLIILQPLLEKKTGLKLSPTYTYARIYKKGDILKRHKDRYSCEISCTLNLGGTAWPIFINSNFKEGHAYGKFIGQHRTQNYSPSKSRGTKITLGMGDLLLYSGCELEHWREPFDGEYCVQVFLHYNKARGSKAKVNRFDRRLHLGLPEYFIK